MLKLKMLAQVCEAGACPTVWTSEDITSSNVIVQGYVVEGVTLPDGEVMVEVPFELLRVAATQSS